MKYLLEVASKYDAKIQLQKILNDIKYIPYMKDVEEIYALDIKIKPYSKRILKLAKIISNLDPSMITSKNLILSLRDIRVFDKPLNENNKALVVGKMLPPIKEFLSNEDELDIVTALKHLLSGDLLVDNEYIFKDILNCSDIFNGTPQRNLIRLLAYGLKFKLDSLEELGELFQFTYINYLDYSNKMGCIITYDGFDKVIHNV